MFLLLNLLFNMEKGLFKILRILFFSLIVAGLEVTITFLIEKDKFHLDTWGIILVILVAAITGFVIELFRESFNIINEQSKQIEILNSTIEAHINAIPNLQKIYDAFNAVKEKKYRDFIRGLIHESAIERIWLVPKYENYQFYEALMESFKICDKWWGIHQGKIELLLEDSTIDSRNDYLEALREFASLKDKSAKRIVIIKSKEEFDILKDSNSELLKRFKLAAGKVNSYMILEDSIKTILEGKDLQDAALLDETIFLQHDREKLVLDFECGDGAKKAKIVMNLFSRLDKFLMNPSKSSFKFHRIS